MTESEFNAAAIIACHDMEDPIRDIIDLRAAANIAEMNGLIPHGSHVITFLGKEPKEILEIMKSHDPLVKALKRFLYAWEDNLDGFGAAKEAREVLEKINAQ